ncbi:radical SAM protein [Proteus alimentorum]|uniref:Radical SAM protein n=1 Tax=Proteus alimentorum TaxID=1973495 RepID=A0ABS0IR78_9GAMM|nr:radical SAM protein [Proteus alimentorum]MBG2875930.1 radical SAM protein [Proteus alimentorum]MBG2878515.1 radical SAM protein [Proteus alimentorum]
MPKVFFISAGQNDIKKEPSIKNTKNMYLNYGALLLSTIIKKAGFDVTLIHGHFKKPIQFINELIDLKITDSTQPIFISIPSFYALSWTKEITKLLKEKVNNKIYVGGRWIIDNRPDLLKKELDFVDGIITDLGENKILKYLTGKEDNNNYSNLPLDYTLLYERELFQPSIEISRGCGMGCSFCQEKNIKLEDLKPAKSIVSEYNKLLLNDSLNEMTPYFECSMFKPTKEWLNELINEREKNNSLFSWRTESRVDSINSNLIPLLAKAGLKVIDLGLESASIIQLHRMKKKEYKPEVYLKKASDFIKECHDNNIKTKINIMLYAGENEETINETKQWLREHNDYIYGVSVGVVSAFGWDCNKKEFIAELESYGATVCEEKSILGVTNFHLSNELNYDKSIKIAKEISNEFMSMDNYFYLKSFSYYPRNYSKKEFLADINQY